MAASASPLLIEREVLSFGKVVGRASTAHSRSTSAGSAPSDDHSSALQDSPSLDRAYPAGAFGLPEYDYPTQWSIQRMPQLPEMDCTIPLVVKNTFLGFDAWRSPSFEEFYEERKIQSCPASGITFAPPPGLDPPEEAKAKLAEAETSLFWQVASEAAWTAEVAAKNTALPTNLFLPSGLLDPPLDAEAQPFVPPAPLPQPFVLDLQSALGPDLSKAPVPAIASPECPQLGSPECPTLGSHGHWFDACKPCAFLYTKGCSNGILCQFCHLCDADAKKRRIREKRAAIRNAKRSGC